MTMRHRSRGAGPLAAASLFVLAATALAAPGDEVTIAERLRDARARISAHDAGIAAELLVLEQEDAARPVADVIAYLAAEARAAADETVTRRALEQVLTSYPTSPILTRVAADLAALAPSSSDDAWLRNLVAKYAGAETELRPDGARLLARAGVRLGTTDPATAADFLMRARKLAPGSSAARDAATALHKIWTDRPSMAPHDADSIFAEAKLVAKDGDAEQQRAWVERFIERYPKDPRLTEALLMRAQGIARDSGRTAAAEWLEIRATGETALPARARLLYAAATHRWNANEDALALTRFEQVVALATGVADEQRSHYSIGRIHETAGRFAAAGAAYRRARSGSDATVAAESRWRSGWVDYLAGDFVAAAEAFGEAARNSRSDRPRDSLDAALYWQARSLERAGTVAKANEVYGALLGDSPDSFYAYLAEKRTGRAASLPRPLPLPQAATQPHDAGETERLERITILNLAGFSDLADVDVVRLLDGATTEQRLRLLPSLSTAGAYTTALKTALALSAAGQLTEEHLYFFLYPLAFADIVQGEAGAKSLDPYLVYALMKQESVFEPHAVSPASACGLMQLLPSTARRLTGVTSEPALEPEALFDPTLNIRLGVAYLAELAERFSNDPVFILASYNAGEKSAEGWKQRFGRLELDELVEHISYRETRQYVKKVLGNYRNYLRLYGGLRPFSLTDQSEEPTR